MKRLIYTALLLVAAVSCGTTAQAPREDADVNIGYGTVKKSSRTGAISSVQVKENDTRTYKDIYEYLEGRVAGVEVTYDKRIIVRGTGTVNGNTDPLILVDGQEWQDISALNPNDVKSVDVIKGSATAIYGMRGANGVILITTKK